LLQSIDWFEETINSSEIPARTPNVMARTRHVKIEFPL